MQESLKADKLAQNRELVKKKRFNPKTYGSIDLFRMFEKNKQKTKWN
jgi:hypothetical protein